MRAFIKEDKWDKFKELANKYGFYIDNKKPKQFLTKVIDNDLELKVQKKTREMHLLTPMGGSPFMEIHIPFYRDLYDDDFVEFIESKFD